MTDDGDRFDDYRADQMVREHDAREESAALDQRAEDLERQAFIETLTENDVAAIARRARRGETLLEIYAVTYYPGAESTDDADGAFTVAGDVIADTLHRLEQLGHEDPERVLDLARAHFVEERVR